MVWGILITLLLHNGLKEQETLYLGGFTPNLSLNQWQLILAKVTIDFHSELHYGEKVELKTFISRVGNSSFDVYQEAWQQGTKCASGIVVMVHFDLQTKKSKKIIKSVVEKMLEHSVK